MSLISASSSSSTMNSSPSSSYFSCLLSCSTTPSINDSLDSSLSSSSSSSSGKTAHLVYQVNKFTAERVAFRRSSISKNIREIVKITQDILKEVEIQEPRFVSSLAETSSTATHSTTHAAYANGGGVGPIIHYDGLRVVSSNEFEVTLYLNQMGVFNFVDDGSLPGCSVLKLSDGRKRSMSLWVEFITASGYLSARKIRSRFQTLVAQACDKSCYRDIVKMIPDTSEVKLRIRERFIVQITPAFRCSGLWPRSAAHWPLPGCPWPSPSLVQEVKAEGFDLLSKECPSLVNKQSSSQQSSSSLGLSSSGGSSASSSSSSSMEGDAWVLCFTEAEDRLLLSSPGRKRTLSILKTLRDRHLECLPGNPISNYHLKTLTLFECEKHPREMEWDESTGAIADRILGILLQLISCLQSRRCPHYFLPNLDLFRGKSHAALENAAKQVWRLTRELLTSPRPFDKL